MVKRRGNSPWDKGAYFFVPAKTKKSKYKRKLLCGSTVATKDMLCIVAEENPILTINQLKDLFLDKDKYIYMPDVIEVLDKHINEGYGDVVPNWRYSK